MDDTEAYIREAVAIAEKVIELGLARRKLDRDELTQTIRELVLRPKKCMKIALKEGLIPGYQP